MAADAAGQDQLGLEVGLPGGRHGEGGRQRIAAAAAVRDADRIAPCGTPVRLTVAVSCVKVSKVTLLAG